MEIVLQWLHYGSPCCGSDSNARALVVIFLKLGMIIGWIPNSTAQKVGTVPQGSPLGDLGPVEGHTRP